MASNTDSGTHTGENAGSLMYEIRVKGRLSEEQWLDWFDNISIKSKKGETVLNGAAEDQSALYGIIARLRDLAVPLQAVKVIDADSQHQLSIKSRRYHILINILILIVYLLLLGGLTALIVNLISEGELDDGLHPALGMAILFAVSGSLAYAFQFWSKFRPWLWLAYSAWIGSAFTFLIFVAVAELLPTSVAIGLILFTIAVGVFYGVNFLRRKVGIIDDAIVKFEKQNKSDSSSDS